MVIDNDWAHAELDKFLGLAELYRKPSPRGVVDMTGYLSNRGTTADITDSAQVVEQILDRILPDWRTTVPSERNKTVNRWSQHIEAVRRARVVLTRETELRERLGDNALWQSGHFRAALGGACMKINAETQNKTGRRDIQDADLLLQVFSDEPPHHGKPRLRAIPDDGSKTYKSVQRGVRMFGEGCYAAIRNPVSHVPGEMEEQVALEHLVALSVLARWIDHADLVTV